MTCSAGHEHRAAPMVTDTAVIANDRVAPGVGLLVLDAPHIAAEVQPGQFVHVRLARGTDFILRRPFSVHRASDGRLEILYQVLGRGTRFMSELAPGDVVDCIGPLGHGWQIPDGVAHALIVAGGLGAAPLGMLAEQLAGRGVAVTVAQGAPTAPRLVARDLFERVARRVEIATDDGSAGEQGFCVAPAERVLAAGGVDVVYTCGPEVMQRAVVAMAEKHGVPCQVSLERLMACGIGACLSCVVTTTDGQKRACVDGPVFDAQKVLWTPAEIPPKH